MKKTKTKTILQSILLLLSIVIAGLVFINKGSENVTPDKSDLSEDKQTPHDWQFR